MLGIAAMASAAARQFGVESWIASGAASGSPPAARSHANDTLPSKLQRLQDPPQERQPYELGDGTTYSIGVETGAVATGDFSGDGLDDVAVLAS